MSDMIKWAENELRLAGFYDGDAPYGGMLGESTLNVVRAFCEEGHSGGSAGISIAVLNRLLRWKPLTSLTNNPEEWMDIQEYDPRRGPMWQSRRCSSCFSTDQGKTYYDIDEKLPWWFRILRGKHARRIHKSDPALATAKQAVEEE